MLRPRHRKDGEAWPPPELPRAQGRVCAGRQGTGQGLLLLGRRAAAGSAPQALEKRAGGGGCTCGPVASAQGPALQLSTLAHVMSGFTKRFPEAQERRGPSRSKYFRRSQAHLARKLKAARDSGCGETGFQAGSLLFRGGGQRTRRHCQWKRTLPLTVPKRRSHGESAGEVKRQRSEGETQQEPSLWFPWEGQSQAGKPASGT